MQLCKFYAGKKVLVTGHTGFKGSWLCRILHLLGAETYGYSLNPPTEPNLYEIARVDEILTSVLGDTRDFEKISAFHEEVSPDIVIHLAAQPIVREGYRIPRETYEINVMGTVNILESIRMNGVTKSFLNVTTDKVYDNLENPDHRYCENDRLDGYDPYSNSKSCSELVTHSYCRSFFSSKQCALSTARAGNVIGGGDFSPNRIVPDCVRSAILKKPILVRNPNSVRPYQHVLEPLFSYLEICARQYLDHSVAGNYNIGPNESDCLTTGGLVNLFCKYWGEGLKWTSTKEEGPHEANYLKLDNNLLRDRFGIEPQWDISTAISKTVDWTKTWQDGEDMARYTDEQISDYLKMRGELV